MPVIVDDALKKKVGFWGKDRRRGDRDVARMSVKDLVSRFVVGVPSGGHTPRNVHHFVGWTRTSRILGVRLV